MYLDSSVFCFTRVTFSTEGISSHNPDTDFALELETDLELEAELPLQFEFELVDNFHGFRVVLSCTSLESPKLQSRRIP